MTARVHSSSYVATYLGLGVRSDKNQSFSNGFCYSWKSISWPK